MTELYRATVTRIGPDAKEMMDAGVFILFGEPVPPALADMSVVHDKAPGGDTDLRVGDRLRLGGVEIVLDEVGHLAAHNLAELGHSVVYLNMPKQKLLPGAMKGSAASMPAPVAGDEVVFWREGE